MADYLLRVDGANLAEITNKVRSEEAGGSKFKKTSVSYHDGSVTNIMTFEELPLGQRPKDITFLANGDPAPPNTSVIGGHVLVAGNQLKPSTAYRSN